MRISEVAAERGAEGYTGTTTAGGACPTCQSVAVTTTTKAPNTDTYWRCEACGDVWNSARTHRAPRVRTAYWD